MRKAPVVLAILGILVVSLFPIYWMVVTSLLPTRLVLSRTPPLLPPLEQVSLAAFAGVLIRRPFLLWMWNSFVVALGSVALSLVVATLGGYSLSRFRTRAQELAGITLLVSRMIPSSLIVIPFFIMASTFHLVDNRVALMLANASVGIPFATWMMKGFFDGIPQELDAAARVDGCSRLLAFWYVVLPLSKPGLAACAIYVFIVSWAEFVFARTLINTPARWTLTTGLVSFVGEHTVDWTGLMAAGTIAMAPVLVLFLLLEPFLVSGMTAGAER
jgi:multiple sugar transport system permease protein